MFPIYNTALWLDVSHAQNHVPMPFVLTCHHPFLTMQHAPEARQAITCSLDNRPNIVSTNQTKLTCGVSCKRSINFACKKCLHASAMLCMPDAIHTRSRVEHWGNMTSTHQSRVVTQHHDICVCVQLFLGDTNRTISETPMNMASSRSHCVFTIYVEARQVQFGHHVEALHCSAHESPDACRTLPGAFIRCTLLLIG